MFTGEQTPKRSSTSWSPPAGAQSAHSSSSRPRMLPITLKREQAVTWEEQSVGLKRREKCHFVATDLG